MWLETDRGEPGVQLLLYGDYRVDFSRSPPVVLEGESVLAVVGEIVELGGGMTEGVRGVEGCPVTSQTVFSGHILDATW